MQNHEQNSLLARLTPFVNRTLHKNFESFMEKTTNTFLTLKWGTLKSWDFSWNNTIRELRYTSLIIKVAMALMVGLAIVGAIKTVRVVDGKEYVNVIIGSLVFLWGMVSLLFLIRLLEQEIVRQEKAKITTSR